MNMLATIIITVLLTLRALIPFCAAQPAIPSFTVKGDPLTIKGDTYVVRDISGVLRHLGVDKDTKKENLIAPGEKIEVQVSPGDRAHSIKTVQSQ